MQCKNGLLNCFGTINLHAVGAFIVINMREGGFVKSTDKLFGIPKSFMENLGFNYRFKQFVTLLKWKVQPSYNI